MKQRKLISFLILVFIAVSAFGAGGKEVIPEGKLSVAVSFNAMKELTEAIGKDKVYISTIIPDSIEPHDFEPKAKDLGFLSSAKLVVYNGLGMEPWMEKAIKSVKNPQLVEVVASRGIESIALSGEDEHHHHPGVCHHHHGEFDPHAWLSLSSAQIMVKNIAAGLAMADPANADFYTANASEYAGKLQALYDEYKIKFENVSKKHFVVGHAAFGYLCRDFGLEQNSVEDVFASGEPTAKKLAELADFCKEHKVTTIFMEEMVSPKVSQTLAKEVGASVETIYTIESAEDDLSYYNRMKNNIEKIYKSLAK
ncbi:ABC transporter substrate-binding protein [Treponema phagedenis]|uniref:ABC transporter substrate-binding protein n=1 Tax=Treponema phagedenis TaxID=162 RepID=A0A0B7GXI0_TREPH|nr:zinc ABC transporter substrate-binding protein [Treponema phagedenis]NVP23013.1 zinc ABC transporter substrate-binding protein [Treponema phagedenis]QEJ95132.1 ABC transporter substrate-binding protein [Treponema phagedenis]QEJ98197.1 ABC transporter substrate-binding protein [Treponema phagedenis]QEK01056.1 ABC transporter substrate-binding protein [Treponema phagedenis]QEK03704.1 ABC transporter substrate-binding protein [Treponema phagedenis]